MIRFAQKTFKILAITWACGPIILKYYWACGPIVLGNYRPAAYSITCN